MRPARGIAGRQVFSRARNPPRSAETVVGRECGGGGEACALLGIERAPCRGPGIERSVRVRNPWGEWTRREQATRRRAGGGRRRRVSAHSLVIAPLFYSLRSGAVDALAHTPTMRFDRRAPASGNKQVLGRFVEQDGWRAACERAGARAMGMRRAGGQAAGWPHCGRKWLCEGGGRPCESGGGRGRVGRRTGRPLADDRRPVVELAWRHASAFLAACAFQVLAIGRLRSGRMMVT